ncbi:MAG: hypothetical protein JWL91_334 [Sphingomonas bacterium]|nr:hypothetical protein [Sphingomonas bacterium]MDB5688458.1 hypothetical protein [Sphingomonas bacterium]
MSAPHDHRCETCHWWDRGGSPVASEEKDLLARPGLGTCHWRHPEVFVVKPGEVIAVLPQTRAAWRCSAWEPTGSGGVGGERDPVVVPIRSAAA